MMMPEPIRVVSAGISLKNIHPNATAHTILTYENGCKMLAGEIVNALIKVEWPATPNTANKTNLSPQMISKDIQ